MKADIRDFEPGWYGLTLGLKSEEIDRLILTLQDLKARKAHFHFRSDFSGPGGIGDIEFYFQDDDQSGNLELEP